MDTFKGQQIQVLWKAITFEKPQYFTGLQL